MFNERRSKATQTMLAIALGASLVTGCAASTDTTPSHSPAPASPTITATETVTASAASPSSTPSLTPSPSAPAENQMLGTATLDDKQQPPADTDKLVVTDVRLGIHDGFERVVFETTGAGQAGWFTKLTSDPRQPGSGFPIEFEGETALWIAIRGVSYPWDAGIPEFDGAVAGQGGVVTGISNQKSYEGQQEFTIGLARQVPYSITLLDNPGRVVVDFKTN